MKRLFVAADVDDATRAACTRVAERLRARGWPGRWVPPENYHLTVAFIGAVAEARVDDVLRAVRDVATSVPALEVRLTQLGAYPNRHKPRVVWVGSPEPVPSFGTLCGAVRSALAVLGFAFDAHADPHVTLARGGGTAMAPLPALDVPRIAPLRIESLTLYESFTARTGARYEPVERFSLRV